MPHRRTFSRRRFLTNSASAIGVSGLVIVADAFHLPGSLRVGATDDASQVIDMRAAGFGEPKAVRFSADGNRLAVAAKRGIALYDAHALTEMWAIGGIRGEGVAISPDNSILAAVYDEQRDTSIRIFR